MEKILSSIQHVTKKDHVLCLHQTFLELFVVLLGEELKKEDNIKTMAIASMQRRESMFIKEISRIMNVKILGCVDNVA